MASEKQRLLKQHIFFSCNSGKLIVKILAKLLIGTGQLVCVTKEESPGKYYITVKQGTEVWKDVDYNDAFFIFSEKDGCGILGADSLSWDVDEKVYDEYYALIEQRYFLIINGIASFVIDQHKIELRSMKIAFPKLRESE